jgi:hypothetical protein
MEGTVGAPPQRVCPRCARISYAAGPLCPYCRARFRRTSTAVFAWMLALAVVVVLAGTALMFYFAGREYRSELDKRAAAIQSDFDAQVQQLRKDVGSVPTTVPTPFPTPTPTPSPSPSPTATPTPAPGKSTPTPTVTLQP